MPGIDYKKDFSRNLKHYISISGKNQTDLANDLKISQSTISSWCTGTKLPRMGKIQMLADYFGIQKSDLLTLDPESTPSEDSNLRPLPQKTSRSVKIPVLGRVPAGTPIEAIEDIIDWEEIPEVMTAGGREYFALQVSGDSMYPKYLEGDVIVVRRQNTCNSGSDCVVYVNGYDATLKTVKLPPSGGMSLQPMNPTYPPRTYTAQEVAELPVSIAGVVVELRRKINV